VGGSGAAGDGRLKERDALSKSNGWRLGGMSIASLLSLLLTACSSGTGGSGSGGSGGGGGPPGECVPSESSAPVDDACGVFVSQSLGDDGNAGTKSAPFASLEAAIAASNGKPVYVCGEAFHHPFYVNSPVTLYSGLDCTNGWVYDATKRALGQVSDDQIALGVGSEAIGAKFYDFYFGTPGNGVPGHSSIGAIVRAGATVSFTRCYFSAGWAHVPGFPGDYGGPSEAPADLGETGGDAGITGVGSLLGGGGGFNDVCSLTGGKGGDGGDTSSDGLDGTAGDGGNGGIKGMGDSGAGCTPGGAGDDGAAGLSGAGSSSIGELPLNAQLGGDGADGVDGTPGRSGGGGGGSKATASVHGAGGGGGGAGGCGGRGGQGGKRGGSSIALVSIDATVTLIDCQLSSGQGADGGTGGDGQPGQPGGTGGIGSAGVGAACDGGNGGKGGNGGNGGGGRGGHSLGIAFTGTMPVLDDATKNAIEFEAAGLGGLGGSLNVDMNHGADGIAAKCWDFSANATCGW
jgi:hypothetical protein